MKKQVYRFQFARTVHPRDIEETFILSVIAVESLYGRSRVRMESRYRLDRESRTCEIDTSTSVGIGLARIFTGYATLEYGDASVTIEEELEGEVEGVKAKCSCAPERTAGVA